MLHLVCDLNKLLGVDFKLHFILYSHVVSL